MLPFIVSKYVKFYTNEKLYGWPVQMQVNESANYNPANEHCCYKTHVASVFWAFYLLTHHFVVPLRSVSVHVRLDYFKFPRQYVGKLHDSIIESCYYTSSDC